MSKNIIVFKNLDDQYNFQYLTSWTPEEISTTAWYDASDTDTITQSNGDVSQWDDKSGNDNHATQDTGSAQPVTNSDFNGNNSLYFDGSSAWMDTGLAQLTTAVSIFSVLEPESKGTNQNNPYLGAYASFSDGGCNCQAQTFAAANPTKSVWYGTLLSQDQTFYNGATDQPVSFTKGIFNHYASSVSTAGFNYIIGNRADGATTTNNYKGKIGEIIIVPSVLSTADRQKVEGYLAWKWGLEDDLPSDHQYKNSAPITSN
jgi:hypothetical protein